MKCEACGYDPGARVKRVGSLWLPVSAVSGNALQGNGKGPSGWKYRTLKRRALSALETCLYDAPLRKAADKRRVFFVRHYIPPQRPFDTDNLVAGMKPIRDCLTMTGLIKDDSARWFEGHYSQEAGDLGGITIRREDML